jgi:hypothetical protein
MSNARSTADLAVPSNAHSKTALNIKLGQLTNVGAGTQGPNTNTNLITDSSGSGVEGAINPATMYTSTMNNTSWGSGTSFTAKPACFFMQTDEISSANVSLIRDWVHVANATQFALCVSMNENVARQIPTVDYIAFQDTTSY